MGAGGDLLLGVVVLTVFFAAPAWVILVLEYPGWAGIPAQRKLATLAAAGAAGLAGLLVLGVATALPDVLAALAVLATEALAAALVVARARRGVR